MKEEYDGLYVDFDDDRRFEVPDSGKYDGKLANRYLTENGVEFWFNANKERVETSDASFFLQFLRFSVQGHLTSRMFVEFNGKRIQLSKEKGAPFEWALPIGSNGLPVWEIGEIGAPLHFYTGWIDQASGIERPIQERRQILTNTSAFSTATEQNECYSSFMTPCLGMETLIEVGHTLVAKSRLKCG